MRSQWPGDAQSKCQGGLRTIPPPGKPFRAGRSTGGILRTSGRGGKKFAPNGRPETECAERGQYRACRKHDHLVHDLTDRLPMRSGQCAPKRRTSARQRRWCDRRRALCDDRHCLRPIRPLPRHAAHFSVRVRSLFNPSNSTCHGACLRLLDAKRNLSRVTNVSTHDTGTRVAADDTI